ncbi:tryptophanase [Dokdonella sp.]|uniref:tryptophanase n=1 Tax=Dokdonella sp. TaxID=2291710 RepID=UPI0025C13418|nr:tryptophanase [Dokdonella sp.]MBX3689142.1 tryptophanase [Dokdonella sp.]
MATPVPVHEPHKVKTVRPIAFPGIEERKRNLAAAHFNTFNLTPRQVAFDMVSYGCGAVTQEQLAGQLLGDEAYAGARNFETMNAQITRVLGHTYVCPTHNTLGSVKILLHAFAKSGQRLPSNARARIDLHAPRGIELLDVRDHAEGVFTGNFDLARLETVIGEQRPPFIGAQAFADGQHPLSLANLRAVRELADRHGLRLVLDVSRVVENAWYIQCYEPGLADRTIADLVKLIAKSAHAIMMDGAQDARANTGGFLATDNPADHERFINDIVVFEGLHTYGGMAGRTMEMIARGLELMCEETSVQWAMAQTERFTARLREGGVPLERGCDGAYLQADQFLPQAGAHAAHALACALYQTSGVRALVPGLVGRDSLLPLQIPRLAMTNRQLDQVADAVIALYRQREQVPALKLERDSDWHDALHFGSVFADLAEYHFDCEPWLIHTLEPIALTSREQRERAIREAGWNTFLLRSADVAIDLLTDSGTTAMSTAQWAAYDAASPTPATSDAYLDFVAAIRDTYGYDHVLPTHQGRAAEQILSEVMIKPGQIVPGNMYFTTTKVHQEYAGGVFADVIVDEAHDSTSTFRWKGNIDIAKLDALVREHGADKIAYISFELSVNLAGGQPVSMDNLREVYAWTRKHGIAVMFDATRAVENAYLIQKHDLRYRSTSVKDILREIMLYGDGATVSGKKDFLINIGGLLTYKDNADWARRSEAKLRIYEGGVRDGGLPAADLAAMAQGVREMVDDRYIRARIEQSVRLAGWLREAGVPVVEPTGTHAVFVDARRFLPHLDQDEYPAQRLASEIYVETGVRPMERGNVSSGRKADGKNYRPALELVRLTLSRRVYTDDHLRAVADGIIRLWQRRHEIGGLRFVYEPRDLRFFQGRFEPIPGGEQEQPGKRASGAA